MGSPVIITPDAPQQSAPVSITPDREQGFGEIFGTAWDRLKQAYRGETMLTDHDAATLSGVGSIARNTVGAIKGAAELVKPPSWDELNEAIHDSGGNPAGLSTAILLKRTIRPLADAAKQTPQVPGAVRDINASPDPLGHYLNAAQETASQGAGQAILSVAIPALTEAAGELPASKLTAPVRAAVKGANTALAKYPRAVGSSAGAAVGAATHIPYGAELGGMIGAAVGPEVLPKVQIPGENFGLPTRVMGGPTVAPPYAPPPQPMATTAAGEPIPRLSPEPPPMRPSIERLPNPTSPLDRLRDQPIPPPVDYTPSRPSIERILPEQAPPPSPRDLIMQKLGKIAQDIQADDAAQAEKKAPRRTKTPQAPVVPENEQDLMMLLRRSLREINEASE